ncbi:hypothetical protein D3C71_2053110 [compost metagenome]
MVEAVDHVTDSTGPLHFETQAGTQADQFQQVGGNAAKVAGAVEEGQWRGGFVDHHPHHRMAAQPALFAL